MFNKIVLTFNSLVFLASVGLALVGLYQAVFGSLILAPVYYGLSVLIRCAFVDIPESREG